MRRNLLIILAVLVVAVPLYAWNAPRLYATWLLSRAQDQLANGNDKENVRLLKKASRLAPDNSSVWWKLCEGYQFTNELDLAIAACKENVKRHPDEAHAYNSLGLAYMAAKDYPNAASAFDASVTKSPEAILYSNYLWALESSEQYEKAITATQKWTELSAKNPSDQMRALENLAAIYAKLGQTDQANSILSQMHRLDPAVQYSQCNLTKGSEGNLGVTCHVP